MKFQPKVIFILTIIFFNLTSCFDLRFTSTYPVDQENMKTFPIEMIGSYNMVPIPHNPKTEQLLAKQYSQSGKTLDSVKFDSLVITKESFKLPMIQKVFSINDSIGELRQLNDTCFIFSSKNVCSNNETWALFPFTFVNNRITLYSNLFLQKVQHEIMIELIKQYTSVNPVYKIVERKKRGKVQRSEIIEYWLVCATEAEFEKLLANDVFPKLIEFEKIE